MSHGFFNCVTCPVYSTYQIHTVGYTAQNAPVDAVRESLLTRYRTSLLNAECVAIVPVNRPREAERALFGILEPYRVHNELFKADFDTIIGPAIHRVTSVFGASAVEPNRS